MPFYKFGETIYLDKIPDDDWVKFIVSRFVAKGKHISDDYARLICRTVDGYSSYVQELAWDVFAETEEEVNQEDIDSGIKTMLCQNSALFQSKIENLTSFQMNFIRAICDGVHSEFGSKQVIDKYRLGTKSNISRLKSSLEEKELVETSKGITILSDPVFELWFKSEYM